MKSLNKRDSVRSVLTSFSTVSVSNCLNPVYIKSKINISFEADNYRRQI
jgi:hypothetical protein